MEHLLTHSIKRAARELGFQAVGIASLPPAVSDQETTQHNQPLLPSHLLEKLLDWLQRGFHGAMGWLARNPVRRSDPRLVLPGCCSLICVGMNYFTDYQADERVGNGRIARYAWGQDYHGVFDQRLKRLEKRIQDLAPEARTKRYVDTGPIMEKAWAQQAGLGWIGKHSNVVSPDFGSWLLLGEILTTLDLEPDDPGTDLCGSCSLCIKACPTNAIPEPYVIDATQCLSYLTIEYRGSAEDVPEELKSKMGNRIFGCDDCLDACPYNSNAVPTQEPAFQPIPLTLSPDLLQLSSMKEAAFSETFRQSPIRRAKHEGFQRNIGLALRVHSNRQS